MYQLKSSLSNLRNMVLKESGLNLVLKWNHNSIISFTDTETVMLDFDESTFKTVKYWANRTMKRFKLKGYIILKSSKDCYHVVFDRKVSWSENMWIVAYVALSALNRGLRKWQLMQCIKESSTLRVSSKREKPSPRIVHRYGKQDEQVKDFLRYRRLIKKTQKRLSGLSEISAR